MPKASSELTISRKNEIVDACRQLYQTRSFREITIKDIGAVTSFTRTSIYNYFQTKEEIFLAMLQQEYDLWCKELQIILETNSQMDADAFADALAKSLEHRPSLLKLISMNHFDMEENSRQEQLNEFKKSYGKTLDMISACLTKFFPQMDKTQIQHFIYIFFPFLFGIYPYTTITQKQINAMQYANINFAYQSIYEITKQCIRAIL
ncbi:MAG: TetR family transcriptional regulator [Proteobacteria bacterium]|jgi:AcrR family transcriptional regulator|nr:TetR family transcriptional regulator [Pseudomonadota bacterium]